MSIGSEVRGLSLLVLPDGRVEAAETDDCVGVVSQQAFSRSILFLDDECDGMRKFAKLLAEAINAAVVMFTDGNEAARLVPHMMFILLDMADGSDLDAGFRWIEDYGERRREDSRLVVLTQHDQIREQAAARSRELQFEDVIMKSDASLAKRRRILQCYNMRRKVEGYVDSFDKSRGEYLLRVPSWSTRLRVPLLHEDIAHVLRSRDPRRTRLDVLPIDSVVVGHANLWARDGVAVDFTPIVLDGVLPPLAI